MSYGKLTPEQAKAILPYVKNRQVTDLGAGDLWFTKWAAKKGAIVTAVDKYPQAVDIPGVRYVTSLFKDFTEPLDVAVLSWPPNYACQLSVERAEIVIYLGKCTGGLSCGDDKLWKQLTAREALVYIPHWDNTLIIYGGPAKRNTYYHEEIAGLTMSDLDQADPLPYQAHKTLARVHP